MREVAVVVVAATEEEGVAATREEVVAVVAAVVTLVAAVEEAVVVAGVVAPLVETWPWVSQAAAAAVATVALNNGCRVSALYGGSAFPDVCYMVCVVCRCKQHIAHCLAVSHKLMRCCSYNRHIGRILLLGPSCGDATPPPNLNTPDTLISL